MACPTAVRTTGSPRRFTTPWMALTTPTSSSGASTLPVSIRAQVEALTSDELDWPRWEPQRPGVILSSIRASTVSASGTRKSASARHMSATPSLVERPYSPRKLSIMVGSEESRTVRTRSAASCEIA